MTEEQLKQIEANMDREGVEGLAMYEVEALLREVRRLAREREQWAGAIPRACDRADAAERWAERLHDAIRKALRNGQVGDDAAAILLEALKQL